jgi:hypothetical protein
MHFKPPKIFNFQTMFLFTLKNIIKNIELDQNVDI